MELDDYLKLETHFAAAYGRCSDQTMTSPERMFAVWQAVEHINAQKIVGDVVECGVWRGGSTMLAAMAFDHFGDQDRNYWLYDTYEGMPPADDVDVVAVSGDKASNILANQSKNEDNPYWAIASLDVVQANMGRTGQPADRFHYVKGMVEDTLPATMPDEIALLRLDTDWYASTMHELVHLWPRLTTGGVVIIDDYGFWEGARKAVEDYFAQRDDRPFLARIDVTGRMAVKTG